MASLLELAGETKPTGNSLADLAGEDRPDTNEGDPILASERAGIAYDIAMEHKIPVDTAQRLVAGPEPSAFGKYLGQIKQYISDKTGLLSPDISPIDKRYFREDLPLPTIAAQVAGHFGAETVSGLTATAANILTNKTAGDKSLAELVDRVTGFQPTQREVSGGKTVENLAAFVPVGMGVNLATKAIPAAKALKIMLNAGLTFGSTEAAIEFSRNITEGTPVNWKEIHLQSGVGVLFGGGEVAVAAAMSGLAKGIEKYWGEKGIELASKIKPEGMSLEEQVARQEVEIRSDVQRARESVRAGNGIPQDLREKYVTGKPKEGSALVEEKPPTTAAEAQPIEKPATVQPEAVTPVESRATQELVPAPMGYVKAVKNTSGKYEIKMGENAPDNPFNKETFTGEFTTPQIARKSYEAWFLKQQESPNALPQEVQIPQVDNSSAGKGAESTTAPVAKNTLKIYQDSMPNATEEEILKAMVEDEHIPPARLVKKYAGQAWADDVLADKDIARVAAKARLRNPNNFRKGFAYNPIPDIIDYGKSIYESGKKTFTEWSAELKRIIGEHITPYLERAWDRFMENYVKERTGHIGFGRGAANAGKDAEYFIKTWAKTAKGRVSSFGEEGKALVRNVEYATRKASNLANIANLKIHEYTKPLTKPERENFGKVVNYVQWQSLRSPKNAKWKNTPKEAPSSPAQREAAEIYLDTSAQILEDAGQVGVTRRLANGKRIPTAHGGVPWPKVVKPEYRDMIDRAVTKGETNEVIEEMVRTGVAKDPQAAIKLLSEYRQHLSVNGGSMLVGVRKPIPIPDKFISYSVDDVLGEGFWNKLYSSVEFARAFGGEEMPLAERYINRITQARGTQVGEEVRQWFNRLRGIEPPQTRTEATIERVASIANSYQTFKLSIGSTVQNMWQPLNVLMHARPTDLAKAIQILSTRAGRKQVLESGAVPYDPFKQGMYGDLTTANNRHIEQKLARAWAFLTGMSPTEKLGNSVVAMTRAQSAMKDLELLIDKPTKAGQIVRSILTLGGDNPSAIRARLERTGVDMAQVMERGYFTPEEIAFVMQEGAEATMFRNDLLHTPLPYQDSPVAKILLKYKVPFAYNMSKQAWDSVKEIAKYGNFRPLVAFLLVNTLIGEIYQYVYKEKILGEEREDMPIMKRLWQDMTTGGAVGIFTGLMFGKDALDKVLNYTGGPTVATGKNVVATTEKIVEAPSRTGRYLDEFTQKEVPQYKHLRYAIDREHHASDVRRWGIKGAEPASDATKRAAAQDLYDALSRNEMADAKEYIQELKSYGMKKDDIEAAMNGFKPVRLAKKKQGEWKKGLDEGVRKDVEIEQKAHKEIMARFRSLHVSSSNSPNKPKAGW